MPVHDAVHILRSAVVDAVFQPRHIGRFILDIMLRPDSYSGNVGAGAFHLLEVSIIVKFSYIHRMPRTPSAKLDRNVVRRAKLVVDQFERLKTRHTIAAMNIAATIKRKNLRIIVFVFKVNNRLRLQRYCYFPT